MKQNLLCGLLAVAFLTLTGSPAMAQGRGFGIGVILGEPSGIALKEWVGPTTAFDGAVAWSFRNEAAIHLHADYLIHKFGLLKVEEGSLPIYFGIGARLKLGEDASLAVRVPVGVDYLFAHDPLDIFLELVPMLVLTPSTEAQVSGGLGIRYFFGQK